MLLRPRGGASSSSAAPVGRTTQPKATRKDRACHSSIGSESPVKATDEDRPPTLPRKLLKIVGLRRCAVGCMIGPPWLVQGIHIVTRTLWKSHEDIYKRFARHVGVKNPKTGEYEINLDDVGNYEWAHFALHHLFDGRSVQGRAYGGGAWAFFPDLEDFLARLDAAGDNANYKTLYPKGLHAFGVYGFPCDEVHVYGRYSSDERTYAHSYNRDGKKWTKASILEYYMERQHDHGPVETRILQVGDQGFIIISHMNPVFVVFDYALKMKYRILDNPELAEGIPLKDVNFFTKRLWPRVRGWFEDTEGPETDDAPEHPVNRANGRRRGVQSEGAAQVAPVVQPVPRQSRSAPEPAPVVCKSSSSPLTESAAVAEVRQYMLFGGPPTYQSKVRPRYASSDAGASATDQSQSDDTDSVDGTSSNSTFTGVSGSVAIAPVDYDSDVDSEFGADECDPEYDDCGYIDDGEPNADDQHGVQSDGHDNDDDPYFGNAQKHDHAVFDDNEEMLYHRWRSQRVMSESPCPAGPMHADDPAPGDDSDGESTATIRDERDTNTFADANATDQEPPSSDDPPPIPPLRSTIQATSTRLPALSISGLKKPTASKKSKKTVRFARKDEDNPGELDERSDGIKKQSASSSSSASDPSCSSATTTAESPPIESHPATNSEPPPDDSPPESRRRSTRIKQPLKPPGTVHAPPPNASSHANRLRRTGKANKAATASASVSATASSSSGQVPDKPRPPAKTRGRKRTRDDRDADDDQNGIGDQVEDDVDADKSDDVESVHSEYLPPAKRVKRTKAAAKGKGKPHK
ncbi:hypothetical protein EV714DRAFT_238544 [Schizophyllum commune]